MAGSHCSSNTVYTRTDIDDGRDRIHKQHGNYILQSGLHDVLPGEYEIIVGSYLQNTTNLVTYITI